MRNNSIFTYALIGILALLLLVAGYKACQMKQQKQRKAEEEAKLEQTLRDLGIVETDTADLESAYVSDSVPAASRREKPVEEEAPVTKPAAGKSKDAAPASATGSGATKPATKPKSSGTTAPTGRYMVVTGSFRVMDNARDELETLIKQGYVNAEIKKFNSAYATVIALRTNNRNQAELEMAKLRLNGYPGAYIRQ